MKRQLLIGILILLAAVLVAAVLIAVRDDPEEKPPEDVAPLVQVAPVELRTGNLTVDGAGTVAAREEVTLAAEVAGKLTYVNPGLRAGQFVQKGAVLFRIDTADYVNAVQIAQADVAAQRVAVLQAREEVALAQSELERFRRRGGAGDPFASVDESDYAARILPPDQLTRERQRTAPPRDMERASGLATRRPQLRSAIAGLQRAQARLVDAQNALADTTVRAPFSGIVRSEDAALGGFVQPGQALGSIVSSAVFEAVIPMSEQKAALIPGLFGRGAGGQIEASVFSEYGGKRYRWQAYVDRVNSVLNPQTRTIDVFLRIPNPINGGAIAAAQNDGAEPQVARTSAPPLLVGSFVQAQINGIALDEYVVIPVSALRPGDKIWLVRGGKLDIVDVEIFQRGDDTVYISSEGLRTGDMIVVGKLGVATQGMKVRSAKVDARRESGALRPQPVKASETKKNGNVADTGKQKAAQPAP